MYLWFADLFTWNFCHQIFTSGSSCPPDLSSNITSAEMHYLTYPNLLLLVLSSSYLFLHNAHHHLIVTHLTCHLFGFLWFLTCMLTIWRQPLCLPWSSHFKHSITSYWMNIVSLKGRWREKMAVLIQYRRGRESFILMARII